jgi:hypothetical protein
MSSFCCSPPVSQILRHASAFGATFKKILEPVDFASVSDAYSFFHYPQMSAKHSSNNQGKAKLSANPRNLKFGTTGPMEGAPKLAVFCQKFAKLGKPKMKPGIRAWRGLA